MKCESCERQADGGLCRYHQEAKENLMAAFADWQRAYGSLDWAVYLDRIKRNPRTGQWAKEVADILGDRVDKKRP